MSPAPRLLLPALHGLALLAVLVAVWLQLDRPLAPPVGRLPAVEAVLGADLRERVAGYRGPRYLLSVVVLVLGVAVPAWWALTARGRAAVAGLRARVGDGHPLRAAAVLAPLVLISLDLLLLPLAFWAGYVQEGQYGFRTQGLAGWARDWLVGHAPVWIGAGIVAPLALAIVRRLPRAWPPMIGLGAGLLTAALTVLGPLLLEPLWLRTTPLEAGPTRTAIEQVLTRADEPVRDIVVGDASRRTTKANAYVSGLGATRRVVLYDTLLTDFTPDEVAVVVAHELAHDRHGDIARHVWLGVAGGVVLAYAAAFALNRSRLPADAAGRPDARVVPLALLVVAVLMVAGLPVQAAASRRAEAAADWAALELTRDPAAFAGLQRDLAVSHLADPNPPRWAHWLWATHPSARERLGMAQAWARRHGGATGELDSAP